MNKKIVIYFFLIMGFFLSQCSGEAGTRVGNPPSETTKAFPTNFAIASPLDTSTSSDASTNAAFLATETETSFAAAITSINTALNGSSLEDCVFTMAGMLSNATDAECYGPRVAYNNHPDGNDDDEPLPPGDVGLWMEYEVDSNGGACAAAQLNAQLIGPHDRGLAALKALASLVCVMNVTGFDLPDIDNTLDLKEAMQDLVADQKIDASFSDADHKAKITHEKPDDDDTYHYEMVFTMPNLSGETDIKIELTHKALNDDNTAYEGSFSYQYNTTDSRSHCGTDNITRAGSATYSRTGTTDLTYRTDFASFCTHDADARENSGLLSPENVFDPEDNPDGWEGNYNIFMANFNPETLEGNYTYLWQAGFFDDNARVFNVTLAKNDDTVEGSAFFGFGNPVDTTDGNITGFICNWAGPGASHDLNPYLQRQDLIFNDTTDLFTSSSENLAILYAPTNSCAYDGLGDFSYDSDADGNVDTDPTVAIGPELATFEDANGNFIADAIEDAGFVLPASF